MEYTKLNKKQPLLILTNGRLNIITRPGGPRRLPAILPKYSYLLVTIMILNALMEGHPMAFHL